MMKSFDVAIVGAGPSGSCAALTLARLGYSVLMLHKSEKSELKIGESLSSSVKPLLEKINILNLVGSGPHLISYGNLSSWGSVELKAFDFIQDPSQSGWHLNRTALDADLRKQCQKLGVEIYSASNMQMQRKENFWQIEAQDFIAQCGFIIDASGRASAMSTVTETFRKKDDHLVALHAWVQADLKDEDSRSLIEAVPDGWWYSALLPQSMRIFSFQTDVQILQQQNLENFFQKQLWETVHVQKLFPKGASFSLHVRPAMGSAANSFAGRGWLAVGDATMTFDPLSSQGLFHALYTGWSGANAIHALHENNTSALWAYTERLNQIRKSYLVHHQFYYAQEQRWPQQPFWQKRHERALLNDDAESAHDHFDGSVMGH